MGGFMNKAVLLAAAAVITIYACNDASAAGRRPVAAGVGKVHAAVHGRVAELYNQNDDDNGVGIVSQNFETSLDAYDAQAADDFVVPDGHSWQVKEVDVTGVYFNGPGPAVSENVTFYKSS